MTDPLVEILHTYIIVDPLRHLYYARRIYNHACNTYRLFEAGRRLGSLSPEDQVMQSAYEAKGQGDLALDQVVETADRDDEVSWERAHHEFFDAKLLQEIIGIG